MIPIQRFYNPGKLPERMDVEKLLSNHYRSQPRNKQIADVFKDMGEIEKYGSGIRRVVQAFLEAGHKAPEWQQISDGIMVTVHLEIKNEAENVTTAESDLKNTHVTENNNNSVKTTQGDLENGSSVGKTVGETVESTTEKILGLIRENPKITMSELAVLCDMTSDGVFFHLKQMRKKGMLIREGGRKNGYWKVINTNE